MTHEKHTPLHFQEQDFDAIPSLQKIVHLFAFDNEVIHDIQAITDSLQIELVNWETNLNPYLVTEFQSVDLVLLDSRFDEERLDAFCRFLKETPTTRDIPILLLVFPERGDVLLHLLKAGADEYIRTPFTSLEFLPRIRTLLETNELRKQTQRSRERNLIVSKIIFCMNVGMLIEDLIDPVLEDILEHCAAASGQVVLVDREGKMKDRYVPSQQENQTPLAIPSPLLKQAEEKGEAFVLKPSELKDYPTIQSSCSSLMFIPLKERNITQGYLMAWKQEGEFYQNEILSTSLVCDILAMAVSRFRFLEEIAKAHKVMKREFELLGRLQQFLLPKQLPQTKGVQFGAYYQPASDAGGDYYDVLPLADQVYGVVVADVSGHGAPAAMNMGIARSILHTVSLSQETSPAKTMFFLNKLLCRLLGENAYITMFYGILDMEQRTFTWSNAGHVPGYLKRPNAEPARPLGDPTNGPPLGWWPTAEFEEESITLESSDLVLLYTDGVIEAVDMHDAMFESQRLETCITQAKPADSDDTIQCILKELMGHIGENPLQDDVTLLSFSIS